MAKPTLDWTLFSAADVRSAVRILEDSDGGVRDELGFLSIHQYFADWFFPGTSTQQTRLRYVFFVPWAFQHIAARRNSRSIREQLIRAEQLTAKNLSAHQEHASARKRRRAVLGVIGAKAQNQIAVTPPSISYWTTLRRWDICQHTRAELLDSIQTEIKTPLSNLKYDDDGDALIDSVDRFDKRFPICPDENLFNLDFTPSRQLPKSLTFQLTDNERNYLHERLEQLPSIDLGETVVGKSCLFAKLANLLYDKPEAAAALNELDHCWELLNSNVFRSVLDSRDTRMLTEARQFSALVLVGRALYWATLETLRQNDLKNNRSSDDDDTADTTKHRRRLQEVVKNQRSDALKADLQKAVIGKFLETRTQLPLLQVLKATLRWLRRVKADPVFSPEWYSVFFNCFLRTELHRKSFKAKLSKKENRRGTVVSGAPQAYQLGYRWSVAKRFLCDLAGYYPLESSEE